MPKESLINGILCSLNPKFNITNDHYVCGCDLAFFSSIAQVENCLTCFTKKCKCLTDGAKSSLRKEDNKK